MGGRKKSKDDDSDQGSMKSFKDLLRARGGEPEPEEDAQPGWVLETAGDQFDAAAAAERGVDSSRDRITRRPPAFGPMTHGPDVYKDIESEEMRILGSFRVRTAFPDDVLAEAP